MTGRIEFRPAIPADAPAVLTTTRAAFSLSPPLEPPSGALSETVDGVIADLTDNGGWVGTRDDRIIAALRFRRRDNAIWLRRVAVAPDAWRQTLGSRLVTTAHAHLALTTDADSLVVGVRTARPGARKFWEQLGYRPSTTHNYWQELRRDPPYAGVVPTADDMRDVGSRLAALLRPGDLVICTGVLGSGKTTLAQGIGAGLGIVGAVTSPTFVLAREHRPGAPGPGIPFVHVDTYRLGNVSDPLGELDALDLDSALSEAVTFVEWGAGLVERLASNRVEVLLEADPATEERRVVVDGLGPRWADVDLHAVLSGAPAAFT